MHHVLLATLWLTSDYTMGISDVARTLGGAAIARIVSCKTCYGAKWRTEIDVKVVAGRATLATLTHADLTSALTTYSPVLIHLVLHRASDIDMHDAFWPNMIPGVSVY